MAERVLVKEGQELVEKYCTGFKHSQGSRFATFDVDDRDAETDTGFLVRWR